MHTVLSLAAVLIQYNTALQSVMYMSVNLRGHNNSVLLLVVYCVVRGVNV